MEFATGTYQIHSDPNFNYQLNRAVMLSDGSLRDITEAAGRITDMKSFIKEMRLLADKALRENRERSALAYIRTAEFFMNESDPDKERLYWEYKTLFYKLNDTAIKENHLLCLDIPFENGFLPVIYTQPERESKGIVILHGGFDSYMEEFLPALLYLKQQGYSAYLFEGPGQGECIHRHHMPFTCDWHKPVAALMDYFDLKDVTLIGISLGALLALRAAVDDRISRVVAWSVMSDFFEVVLADRPEPLRKMLGKLLDIRANGLVDRFVGKVMRKEPRVEWGIQHGMHVFGKKTPFEFLTEVRKYRLKDISPRITQDVLLLGAAEDHFIPLKMYKEEIDELSDVRSLTFRIFTKKEHAENHCNIGNMRLVLDTITDWIDSIGRKK
ncbi:MAG: alpha/beta fold hydrolase [Clostridiaceae bacterium]|nr:alpha/beta fold hydrolase [Clostridiaceae bacterium]